MGFPAGVQTVTLTGRVALGDGEPASDTITLTPSPPEVVSAEHDVILTNEPISVTPDRVSGQFSIVLLATDAEGFNPTGWTYSINRGTRAPYSISLPAAAPSVDLADLTPVSANPGVYDTLVPLSELGTAATRNVGTTAGTVAAGDDSRFAANTPSSSVVSETTFGQSSTAGAASAYSRGDHSHGSPPAPTAAGIGALAVASNLADVANAAAARTNLGLGGAATRNVGTGSGTVAAGDDSRLTDARQPTGSAGGDLSGSYPNPSVAKVGGVAVSGTAASGKVLTATGANAATWQTPSGSGSGSSIVSQGDDRIDLELVVLTNTASWSIVRTAGGVAIGKSVKAAAGDRVLVAPSFMYTGNQYQLDLAVMGSDGTSVTRYAGSSGSGTTPGAEGYPPLYTQASSFPHISGPIMFTVTASEVDGSGLFTVNLAYKAPSLSGVDQKIYAGSGYIARWVMLNIGPEPA